LTLISGVVPFGTAEGMVGGESARTGLPIVLVREDDEECCGRCVGGARVVSQIEMEERIREGMCGVWEERRSIDRRGGSS
jgi:hypothetical protein